MERLPVVDSFLTDSKSCDYNFDCFYSGDTLPSSVFNVTLVRRYVFRPYDDAAVATEDATRSKRDALTVCVQIAMENVGSTRLKLAEAALERPAEALLTPQALQVLEGEPEVRVDATLAAGANANAYTAAMQPLGVKVPAARFTAASRSPPRCGERNIRLTTFVS